MTHKEENIVNISMMAAELLKDGRIERDDISGHAGLTDMVISLAEQFEKENAGVDWDAGDRDYWEEIDSFAEKELLERYGVERDSLDVELPKDPVVVYAVAGSVKNEIFSGNLDECKAFCEENRWRWIDENTFEWDLEMEDSREDLLPEDYFDALSYYSKEEERDVESEFTRVHADKLVACYYNELPIDALDRWVRYEDLCGESLTFTEYLVADIVRDPYEIGDEDYETINAVKRSVIDFRTGIKLLEERPKLDNLILAAQALGTGSGGAAGAPAKAERDARE